MTIWGLSSGAQYVSTLLVSPAASGLFHKAMVPRKECTYLLVVTVVWHQLVYSSWLSVAEA